MGQNQTRVRSLRIANASLGLLLLTLFLAFPPSLRAQFNYFTNASAIVITGYTGSNAMVNVPNFINGLPVTGIGTWAFAYSTNLLSVTIPNNVTNIGEWAFYGSSVINVEMGDNVTLVGGHAFDSCSNLANVSLSENVITIGTGAFTACTNLASITIPDNVTSLGSYAFYGCTNLTNIFFLGDAPSIGSYAFNYDTNTTVYHIPGTYGWSLTYGNRPTALGNPLLPQTQFTYVTNYGAITITHYLGSGGTVVIPDKINDLPVTTVGIGSFAYCDGLSHVVIPDSVTNIVDWAFYDCFTLSTVRFGRNVARIGESAFNACTNLTSMVFLGNAPTLGPSAFAYNTTATVTYLPGTTGWGTSLGGRPTVLWNPPLILNDDSFGVQSNVFGFNIAGASNQVVVVEACTSLAAANWSTVDTVTLTNTPFYFCDPNWDNYSKRVYRLRIP